MAYVQIVEIQTQMYTINHKLLLKDIFFGLNMIYVSNKEIDQLYV